VICNTESAGHFKCRFSGMFVRLRIKLKVWEQSSGSEGLNDHINNTVVISEHLIFVILSCLNGNTLTTPCRSSDDNIVCLNHKLKAVCTYNSIAWMVYYVRKISMVYYISLATIDDMT
jgi:hypothetical protein